MPRPSPDRRPSVARRLPLAALTALVAGALSVPPPPALARSGGAASTDAPARRPLADATAFAAEAERFVAEALQRLEVVPGVALTVVVDDEVVLARGFGYADPERQVPADADTVYYIASCTKSFTALAAAVLDARGAIDLDSPLSAHLHGVELDPALRPDDVRLRDLLTHTSGIANGPIAFRLAFSGQHDPDTLWRLLAHSTAAEGAPLGTFRYANAGYNILGMILDRELGKPWQDLLRDELFEPAGMTRTTAYASLPARKGFTVAPPCTGLAADGLRRLPLEKQDATMQSAGGMMTTARDLGRWLELQVGEGRIDGRQVIPAEVVRGTHARLAHTEEHRGPFGYLGYGLGWVHGAFGERPVLHHGGGFAGYRATISFMPDARIGVAVMVNEDTMGGMLVDALAAWSYAWWLDLPAEQRRAQGQVDEAAGQLPGARQAMAGERARFAARGWQLGRPRAAYAGTYASDVWGTIVIEERDGDLHVRLGNMQCVGTAYESPETLRVELVPGRGQVVTFEPATGEVERLRMDGDAYERVR